MVCPVCGLANDSSARVCARCNAALAGPAPAAQPTQALPAYAPPPRRSSALPLVAALSVVVILLAVAGIGVVLWRRGSDPGDAGDARGRGDVPPTVVATATTPDPEPGTGTPAGSAEQARLVDGVLTASVASRRKLTRATGRVLGCEQLDRAVSDLEAVGAERRAQLSEIAAADLGALPAGDELKRTLGEALQHALDADREYLSWANAARSSGCGAGEAARKRGDAQSQQAGETKIAFLELWNPVAAAQGLPARTRQDI